VEVRAEKNGEENKKTHGQQPNKKVYCGTMLVN